ncbi:hypothetical protein FACS1894193_00790 [Bacilli bacterium]|nr:hypothetical protein FACS1894193_00790 [Bacilli bacterium]
MKPDNHLQTKALTKYAIEQGYEKCYVVTEPLKGATTRLIRYQAILDVAETSGLEVALIELGEQPFVMPKDEKKAFIFALNSKSLSIAIKEILVSNQKEIGICGYDDWFWTDIALNGVTAIEQDPAKIGEEIARLLLAKLNQEEVPIKTVIPTTLRIRNSL